MSTQSRSDEDLAATAQMKDVTPCCEEVREDFHVMVEDVGKSVGTYCSKHPSLPVCLLFGLGFYVGWKIKPS